MKSFQGIIVVLLAVLIAVAVLEHRTSVELQAGLAALAHSQGALAARIRELEKQRDDLRSRPANTAAVPEAARRAESSQAEAGTVQVREEPLLPPVARPGVTVTTPDGWGRCGNKTESYVVGVDQLTTWGGMPSAYVESRHGPVDGFGGMMQTTSAETYQGKRIRLSGWIRTQDANEGGGHLWMRVDGQQRGQVLQFDNMDNRAVKGTSDWQEASVVLDVPPGASALAYGFFVKGGGKMWLNGTRIEEVGAGVPTTNMITAPKPLPPRPVNLGFNPDKAKG